MRRIVGIALVSALVATLLAACGAGAKREAGTHIRRLLEGNGIGNVHFGQTPATAAAGLERLLGPPESASPASSITPARGICGFDGLSWAGLDVKPNARRYRGAHRRFRASLTVYFKHSRFVGYTYVDTQYITRYGPGDETSIPLNDPEARRLLHGPRLALATAKGLEPGDPLAYARRLYGRALVKTTQAQGTPPNPRLQRLPIWQVDTANGRIYGGILSHSSFYSTSHRNIGGILGGETLNTPCH